MSQTPSSDQLLKRLLAQEDGDSPLPAEHPDDESLAGFAEGAIGNEERVRIVTHLAACSLCRQIVAATMTTVEEEPQIVPLVPKTTRRFAPRPALVLAASLLLAVGLGWFLLWDRRESPSEGGVYREVAVLLTDGKFDRAKSELSTARQEGINSPRLRSLQAEAVREIPSPVALDQAGKLTDFGYDYGGVAARGPSAELKTGLAEASNLLQGAGNDDLGVLLNRGHLRLTQGDPKSAATDFETATRLADNSADAWLGLGLAKFMLDDFSAAEAAFKKCLGLDPKNSAAQINLAMTLEEENQVSAALNAWQAVLASGKVSGPDRQKIEHHLAELGGSTNK